MPPKGPAPKRSRNFVFTVNNYCEDTIDALEASNFHFLCFARETADSGTPHLQGYIELGSKASPCTESALSKNICFKKHPWIGIRNGTRLEAIRYCAKEFAKFLMRLEDKSLTDIDDDKALNWMKVDDEQRWLSKINHPNREEFFFFYGPLTMENNQGKRNDIVQVRQIVKNGGNMRDILDNTNSYQAIQVGKIMLQYTPYTFARRKVFVQWRYGKAGDAPGSTKSFSADQDAEKKCIEEQCDHWPDNGSSQWFDGYVGQKVVRIDELRGNTWNFTTLLRILDEPTLNVPIKGGYTRWCPLYIYITSSMSPADCYNDLSDENIGQLLRRVTEFYEHEGVYNENPALNTVKITKVTAEHVFATRVQRGGLAFNPYRVSSPKSTTDGIRPTVKINIIKEDDALAELTSKMAKSSSCPPVPDFVIKPEILNSL